LVTKDEIEKYRAILNKTFGKLFLNQNKPGAIQQALDKLSHAIYLECTFYGPESIYLCSSYYYMGEIFKKDGQVQKAKNYYQKIIQIWKKFIIEKDLGSIEDYNITVIDRYYYEEAHEHLKNILVFFEIEFGP
jgi:tetratricopeptide (TPR) repeat protein